MPDPDHPFVSRGGMKLAAALDAFHVDPRDMICADLGCSVGGFTDCLLQRGAAHVHCVDTGYGQLAWTLRNDPRTTVHERTNALHFDPRAEIDSFTGCDLVVIDLGWTSQEKAIPAALRWLGEMDAARIITLIKPHYEHSQGSSGSGNRSAGKSAADHVLDQQQARQVTEKTLDKMPTLGVQSLQHICSPIRGGKGGNIEYLALLKRL